MTEDWSTLYRSEDFLCAGTKLIRPTTWHTITPSRNNQSRAEVFPKHFWSHVHLSQEKCNCHSRQLTSVNIMIDVLNSVKIVKLTVDKTWSHINWICGNCNKFYIGRTNRNFNTRFKEHTKDFRYAEGKSKFSEHVLNHSSAYDLISRYELQ